ncbi:MAG: HAD family hydrolase [Desulfuromonadales bacterium]
MFQSYFRKRSKRSLSLDNVQAVFFDLDGTLVDVDMHLFVPVYLNRLTEQMKELIEPASATRAMHRAVAAMFANRDADKTLEAVLFDVLRDELAMTPEQYRRCLNEFLHNDLEVLRPLVVGHALSSRLVDAARARGWQVILATNPIFPRDVVDARVRWGGLDGDKFHHVTTYETEHFCKPNPDFFRENLNLLQLEAERCLMVGNDTLHDLSASQVGMQTCLLTPWCIRRPKERFRADWQGRHEDLLALIEA